MLVHLQRNSSLTRSRKIVKFQKKLTISSIFVQYFSKRISVVNKIKKVNFSFYETKYKD